MPRSWRKPLFWPSKRKKMKREPLIVSISLALLVSQIFPTSLVASASQAAAVSVIPPTEPLSLVVSISLTIVVCATSQALSLSSLCLCLNECKKKYLPDGWIIAKTGPSELTVCNLTKGIGESPPVVKFSVTVTESLNWSVHVYGQRVEAANLMMIPVPQRLKTIPNFLLLLRCLDNLQVCTGNSDEKFIQLAISKKGKFRNRSGKYLSTTNFYLYNYMYICRWYYCQTR